MDLGTAQQNIWFVTSQKRRMKSTMLSQGLLLRRHREQFGVRRQSMWLLCKKNSTMNTTIRLQSRNGFCRIRTQLPNSVRNKRQGIWQGKAFNRKNRKAFKSRLRAFIFIFIKACQWVTTRTTVHPPGHWEGPPSPILLNPQIQGGTEDCVHQLGSDKLSAFMMCSRVSTMETSLNNQGRKLQVI